MIKRIEQVFPDVVAQALHDYVKAVPWKYGWASNKSIEFTHWNHDFTRASVLNGLDISQELPPAIAGAWDYIRANVLGDQTLLRCYVNSHTYGVEGYPHTDSRRAEDNTLVVYMNKEWQRDWGGETVVYDGYDIEHAELPKFNRGLVFPGAQTHQARSVTRICPAQRITLMFKFAARNSDTLRDDIQRFITTVGGDEVVHGKGKLSAHLLRTYDLLKANDYSPTTCGAGALHSIFGTGIFKHSVLKPEQRHMAARVIGEEATRLVELFRDIARPQCLESALKSNSLVLDKRDGTQVIVTAEQLNSLCAIEAANLMDQKALNKYEHLRKFITK